MIILKKCAYFLLTFFLFLTACSAHTAKDKTTEYICVYSDDYLEISYIGCVEDNIQWMTEKGFEEIPVKGVSLSITNKAEHSFFVADSAIYIDNGENIANNFTNSCSYRLYVGKTQTCVFYSPLMETLDPSSIQCDFMAFAINDEFPGFENYDFSFSIFPKDN